MDDSVLFDDLGHSKPPPASVYEDMFDSYFNRAAEAPEPSPKASSSPSTPPTVFDKPVFDDDPDTADPFDAIPLFGGGGGGEGEDVLGGNAAKPERRESEMVGFDEDLFPGLGGSTKSTEGPVREVERDGQAVGFDDDLIPGLDGSMKPAPQMEPETVGFDDGVIPGFGGRPSHHYSAREEPIMGQESESISSSKMSVSMTEDPFVILGGTHKSGYSSFGLFSDPLDNIGMPLKAGNTKVDAPDNTSGMFQSSDMFTEVPKAMPSFLFTSENQSDKTERRSAKAINSMSHSDRVPQEKPVQQASTEAPDNTLPAVNFPEASVIHEVPVTTGIRTLNPFAGEDDVLEAIQSSEMPNDMWLTVSDIVLVTQPTSAPPPSRPPPPLAAKKPPTESVSSETYARHRYQGYHHSVGSANTSKTSQIDDLEDFFTAKPANFANPRVLKDEGNRQYPSIATASFMDWTETGHSKEGNQAFDSMFTSSQNGEPEIDEKAEVCAHEMEPSDEQERLENERIQREHEEEERRAERKREEEFERERENVRQREQEEQRRREKERETRQAVDKAVREARERAAAEARKRAERAAVQKAVAEARERAAVEARERAAKAAAEAKEREAAEAMERAGAESRERDAKAAAEARERVDRAAAEAREKAAAESQEKAAAEARATAERAAVEKAAAEARRRAERAAFERVAAEARQRAANVARERAAAEARQRAANEARERAAAEARARENQQRRATAEPDLESFFGIPSRSSSVPRSYTATTNPFDVQPHGKADSGAARTSGSASPFTQPSSSNLMDDLSSVFGAPSSAVFQEVNGESEERRKARLERHQRTMERAAKALAEKNERDLQAQREQEERHRIGESLDFEIKRWAAGKEGNLRALLSTLQYILWPECGWRPVSLTDLITAASVKKEYRKATLCIHPDKVQQKGANLQQKYIAEKVFDLLKEAWNKFNSEELF